MLIPCGIELQPENYTVVYPYDTQRDDLLTRTILLGSDQTFERTE